MAKLRCSVAFGGFLAVVLVAACPVHGGDWLFVPETAFSGHVGPVNAVLNRGDTVISAGEDGFLEVWTGVSGGGTGTVERFQISPHRIVAIAGRPGASEVSVVESAGAGLFRVSAWDYRLRRKIFTREFRNPVAHVSYSSGGGFVMVGAAGGAGLVFVDSDNGNLLPSPSGLGGTVALAATGRAERNVMLYLSSGFISYRDLDSGVETHRFDAPANLSSPVLFGGNRFIAGLGSQGLTVVNAVSGSVVARDSSVPATAFLSSPGAGGNTFYALIPSAAGAEVRRYSVDRYGNLVTLASFAVPSPGGGGRFTAMEAGGEIVALGTSGGVLILAEPGGGTRTLAAGGPRVGIAEIAVSRNAIAFLAENGTLGFVPLEYGELFDAETIRAERNAGNYNRITPFGCAAPADGSGEDGVSPGPGRFVFWQDRNTLTIPSLRSSDPAVPATGFPGVSPRFPLRAVASHAGRAAFLDSAGNVTVVSPLTGGAPFVFSSAGIMDAAFMDGERLVLARSAISGGTPFLSLSVVTGETVPLSYPAQAGVILHRGASGSVYAATVSPLPGGAVTSVSRLEPAAMADSPRLADFPGEHLRFSLAETPYGIATNLGGEGGRIHSGGEVRRLDRTPGFPCRLAEGGRFLVSLDRDGNIAWHDSRNGSLMAMFRLHPDGWTLQTRHGTAHGGIR